MRCISKHFLNALFFLFVLTSCEVLEKDKRGILKDNIQYENMFDAQYLHEFEIFITKSEWDGITQDMDDYNNQYGSLRTGNFRKANLKYKGINGEVELKDIGIRTRGNTTRIKPGKYSNNPMDYLRTHLMLKFNETFDIPSGTFLYNNMNDRRLFGLRSLNMKIASDDTTNMREMWAYNVINKAGVYAPKAGVAKLYINIDGQRNYFGIYTIIEPVNKSFLTRRFGSTQNDGNMYKCLWQSNGPATLHDISLDSKIGVENWKTNYRPSYDRISNEDNTDYSDLKTFVSNINSLSGANFKSYMDNNFDVDRFLRWMAVNQCLGMPDDYWAMGNNYYLYFGSKIMFIPYDYDHGLNRGWVPFDTTNADIFTWHDQKNDWGEQAGAPLVEKILSINEYKERYKSYLAEFTKSGGIFSLNEYLAFYNKVYGVASNSLNGTVDGDLNMQRDIQQENFITNRINKIRTQLGL